MQIYWNKRKRLHKKRVQLPQDWFGTQIFIVLGHKYGRLASCENTQLRKSRSRSRPRLRV